MRFPNLLPFGFRKKKRNSSPVEYASFTTRTFAVTVDMLMLFLLLTPAFDFVSRQIFPDFYLLDGAGKMRAIIAGFTRGEMTSQQAIDQLSAAGILNKLFVDHVMQFFVSGAVIVFFWARYHATPGMLLLRLYVADAAEGGAPSLRQYIIRYAVGVVATVPLMLGMLPMFFNPRKMALHDFAAHTVVLRRKFKFEYDAPEEAPPPAQ